MTIVRWAIVFLAAGFNLVLLGVAGIPRQRPKLRAVQRGIPLRAVEHIYNHEPLTDDVVRALNNDLTTANVEADAIEIGYPHKV